MSSAGPNTSATPANNVASKSNRILACVLCQQRKIKCNRQFPCNHCVKANVNCVPATLTQRQRRRRFPERDLLERLRHYEDLLKQNDINFEPLHPSGPPAYRQNSRLDSSGAQGREEGASPDDDDGDVDTSPRPVIKAEPEYGPKKFWTAVSNRDPDADDESGSDEETLHRRDIEQLWELWAQSNDPILFGLRSASIDLSVLHPTNVDIFRLWQVYIDNVDPILKVTHAPSLQSRVIEAASNLLTIKPTLEALMFGIYSIAVLSLSEEACLTMFGATQKDLLSKYQFGCQQALVNCSFMRTDSRECLTALYLYLITMKNGVDPYALSALLGVAMRIAQRNGLHLESTYANYTTLEAEQCRRLWWALVVYDSRMCEMANFTMPMLMPTWDCKIPTNCNDHDLRPESKTAPPAQTGATEATFAAACAALSNFIRYSPFYLDFTNPAMKAIARQTPQGPGVETAELDSLEKMMEERYLQHCNPEIPLHFMTIWMMRGFVAKYRLKDHWSRNPYTAEVQSDDVRDAANAIAIRMLECDAMVINNSRVRHFHWLVHIYFPFPAFIHLAHDLRRRPLSRHAARAWDTMSTNYMAHLDLIEHQWQPVFRIFAKMLLPSWQARETALRARGESVVEPHMMTSLKAHMANTSSPSQPSLSSGVGGGGGGSGPGSFTRTGTSSGTSQPHTPDQPLGDTSMEDFTSFLPVPMSVNMPYTPWYGLPPPHPGVHTFGDGGASAGLSGSMGIGADPLIAMEGGQQQQQGFATDPRAVGMGGGAGAAHQQQFDLSGMDFNQIYNDGWR